MSDVQPDDTHRREQQADTYRIMEVEKLISYAFLSFILLIACFNVIGSLSMLIIDKRADVVTLRNLGANDRLISKIFLLEGCMISFMGAIIGVALGLPESMVMRHPFPGPGLGVRVLGEVKKEYLELLRQADAIFMEELNKSGWYHKVSQAFTVFLPVRAVGVMGDHRSYDYVVSLRAVKTIDFMTAKWAELPYDLLGHISNRIINEINGISRVVYDVSGKPPATIEWE